MSADLSNIITRDIVFSFLLLFPYNFAMVSIYNQRTKAINNDCGRYLERVGLTYGPCPKDFCSVHVYTTYEKSFGQAPRSNSVYYQPLPSM